MTTSPIKFGTSGWRGLIADDFTFANVRLAVTGIAVFLGAAASDFVTGAAIPVDGGYSAEF